MGVLVAGRGTVSIVVERTILPGIGDVLLEVESAISVERLDISKCRKRLAKDSHQGQRQGDGRRDWRNVSCVNETGRKTNTNYVDSHTELGQNSTLTMCFRWGDRLGQRIEWNSNCCSWRCSFAKRPY